MDYRSKIKTTPELVAAVSAARAGGRTIVHCHGCFDILHPGHVRHLAWAKSQGDVLVVTVSADAVVKKGLGRPFVPESLRAENLAALGDVDLVAIDDGEWAGPILELLKPDIYVKGKEFENVFTGRIALERELVQAYGGKVLFSSGDVVYSSTYIYESERVPLGLPDERLRAFRGRNGIRLDTLRELIERRPAPRVLVVGDLLVSEEVFCVGTGRTGAHLAPRVKAAGRTTRLSGAAGVARALARLGAEPVLVTIAGSGRTGGWAREALKEEPFRSEVVADPTRPVPRRNRYATKLAELFVAYEYKDHRLESAVEKELIRAIRGGAAGAGAVVVLDHGAGVAGGNVLDAVCEQARALDVPALGLSARFSGMTDVRALSGLTMISTDEESLRQTFCDAASGVADLAALAADAMKSRHFLVSLPDGGSLVLSPELGVPHERPETSFELKGHTPTEYVPCFGPPGEAAVSPEDMLGPLACFVACGAPFVTAAFIAFAAACAMKGTGTAGAELGRTIFEFLEEFAFLPDEREGTRGAAERVSRADGG